MYIDLKLTEESKGALITLGRQVIDPTVLQYLGNDEEGKIISIALSKVIEHAMSTNKGLEALLSPAESTDPAETVGVRLSAPKANGNKKMPSASQIDSVSKKIPEGLTLTAYALKCLNAVADRKTEFTTRDVLDEMGVMTRGTRTVIDSLIRNAISEGSLTVVGVTGNARHLKKVSEISTKVPVVDEKAIIDQIRSFVITQVQSQKSVTIPEISKHIGVGRNGVKYGIISDAILPMVNSGVIQRNDTTWPTVYVSGPKFSSDT
jgi:hypothetical protein